MPHTLTTLPGRYAVCRLGRDSPVPHWAFTGAFCSVTRNADELSVVCDESVVPNDIQHQAGWACLKLEGPFEFNLTGVLTSVLIPLRDAGIGIFAISTFDTDYVMVPKTSLADAICALISVGHSIT